MSSKQGASIHVSEQDKQESSPALSAIVVIPDTYDTVRRTIRYLQAQTVVKRMELVFVLPSRQQVSLDESELACFHSWQVVEVGRIPSIARGFVAGIRKAHAPIIALTEDHSFPDSRWAELFIAAHRSHWAVVGPTMRNGNPDSIISWADFYQAYGEWTQPRLSGLVRHLPGHNSSYKRDILLAYGDGLEDLMEAESVLHRDLEAKGYELMLEAGTCTSHLNFSSWSSWFFVRYYAGRQFAATWSRNWQWYRRLLFTVASPLIPCIRLWRIVKQVYRGRSFGFVVRLLPVLIPGLIVEGAGHMVSYALGAGNSCEKLSQYEFHRER